MHFSLLYSFSIHVSVASATFSSFHQQHNLAMTDSAGANISASSIQNSSKSANNAKEEEKRKTVAEIAASLRQGEDFNLAYALQEEEFRAHYSKNKDQRATMAMDGKMSKEEQLAELERLQRERAEIARRDEEMALELAQQFEAEQRRIQMEQANMDAEMALRLQKEMLTDIGEGEARGKDQTKM